MQIEAKLAALGSVLPPPPKLPPGISISFEWVRVRGNRAYIAGHGALTADGTPAGPFGTVEQDVSLQTSPRHGLHIWALEAVTNFGSDDPSIGRRLGS